MPIPPVFPGTHIEEALTIPPPIAGVPTSITAFIGRAAQGPVDDPMSIFSYNGFKQHFGGLGTDYPMGYVVRDFFENGGSHAIVVRLECEYPADVAKFIGDRETKTGMYALEKVDLLNILCIPPDKRDGATDSEVYQAALTYCVERRAMLIVDAPIGWFSVSPTTATAVETAMAVYPLQGTATRNAAVYFPRLIQNDPANNNQSAHFSPCGAVAGVMARTDATRGVWKAPAGIDASINGTQGLSVAFHDDENGILNSLGINCLRSFPNSQHVIWGARTLRGTDQHPDDFKYVPVRRLALFIEESIYRGTKWAVYEPNNEALWAKISYSINAFLHTLFRQGAFAGTKTTESYFVRCEKSTTSQIDIDQGVLNIQVGFAPLKPAEFVIIQIQQKVAPP